ncbi:MAG: protoglobin domain-containing protein [Myxococcota bacterium]
MSIHGYARYADTLPQAAVTAEEFEEMKASVLFGEADVVALKRSVSILDPQIESILDVWYGFVGSLPHLLIDFSDPSSGPIDRYLGQVRARFGQWIRDTAEANYDEQWIRWQVEIGRRHHRVGKNKTDDVTSTPLVRFRHLFLLAQPIVHTLRTFLEKGGDERETVDAMQEAWRKSVLLQVTLWSAPYIHQGDF